MKKILICITILFLFQSKCYASEILNEVTDSIGINDFIEECEKYLKESDIDVKELFEETLATGEVDKKSIFENIKEDIKKSFKDSLSITVEIIIIIIIHSILKSVVSEIGKTGTTKIVFYLEYLIISTIILKEFSQVVVDVRNVINTFSSFMYTFIPILIVLIISTGNAITGSIGQKLIIFLISFTSGLVKNLIIPILLVSVAIGIVGNFSEKVQLSKLSKYLKSFIFWFFGIVLTLFVTSITLEGTLSSSVDGIAAKTAKAAVSSLIPVVGKILGDATDTVIGSMFVIKNAFGVIGVVIVILISIKPVIDLFVSMLLFYFLSAISEIISEEKITKIIDVMAESYKALFAVLISVIVLFLVGITLLIKISNNGMMYR